jgi:hypothetical protein
MTKKKKTIEDEINEIIQIFDCNAAVGLFQEIQELLHLYDVSEDSDWVEALVGEENTDQVRLVRTCYIASRMAEKFSSVFCSIKIRHPKFWERLEKHVKEIE